MRTKKIIINSTFNILYQLVQLVLSFVIRNLFVKSIGIEFLGLNGLFSNILSTLNLFELGVGVSISYHLYKPLADKDSKQINGIMQVYRRLYFYIGIAILAIGFIIMFFIQNMIKEQIFSLGYLRLVFFIQLISTASTYFLAYKRTLLLADQKSYIISITDTIVNLTMMVVRIVTLIVFNSYIVYLIVLLVQNIIGNIIISIICSKKYSFLKYKSEGTATIRKGIFSSLKNIIIEKVSGYIYYCTDNIIISRFVGITNVGLISNYTLLTATVQTFFVQIINSVQASLGNLVNSEKDMGKVRDVFNKINFLCFAYASFSVVSFLALTQQFITLWLGKEFVLSYTILGLLCANYFSTTLRMPLTQMAAVYGLFNRTKIIAIWGAAINLVLSLIFVNAFGITGVLMGTAICDIVYCIGYSKIVTVKIEMPYRFYVWTVIQYIFITISEVIATIVLGRILFNGESIGAFIGKVMLCIVVPNGANIILFRNRQEFIFLKDLIKSYCYKIVKLKK